MFRTDPIQAGDALLVVDVQNDFLAGGALAVQGANEVVPVLNSYLAEFKRRELPIFTARDWHPADHMSFQARGGQWPEHCVMHTHGAEFPDDLELSDNIPTFFKGSNPAEEAYSAFSGTNLKAVLRSSGVRRLYVGGLTTDYCVLNTVRDALSFGFSVFLLCDAIRAVNLNPGDGQRAMDEMRRLGAVPVESAGGELPDPAGTSSLLTDLYHLTMLRGYLAADMTDIAVFEFFVRRLPPGWNFLIAAGLEQALDYLENFHFPPAELEWIAREGGFGRPMVQQLAALRFTGDVHAMPEGTVFFPGEPILRVTAPITEAQVVETRLINLLHFQTLIASKAARSVLAAPGKVLVDFGLRRAHGAEAGLLASRACYLAGFAATSNVLAGRRFGIPLSGTMAHSFIEACDSEEQAFLRFARANPRKVVLLIDTYDTEAAAATLVRIAPGLRSAGIPISGVRLDSGDLAVHARRVRQILDAGGLSEVAIFASGNIDEHLLARLAAVDAPIDGFGVGTRVVTSADAPYLDCAYKLQAYAGRPRCKLSEGKATMPGAKQVYRSFSHTGGMKSDEVTLDDEPRGGEPQLHCVMRRGRRIGDRRGLPETQGRARLQLGLLPPRLRSLDSREPFPVVISSALQDLAAQLGATGARETAATTALDPSLSGIT